MAKLQPLISASIDAECKKRNYNKLKYSYYISLTDALDGVFYFNLASYSKYRTIYPGIGVCHKEVERLVKKFGVGDYNKGKTKYLVDFEWFIAVIKRFEGGSVSDYIPTYYDDYPERIDDTNRRLFEYIDKYSMSYFNERMSFDVLLKNQWARGHTIYNQIINIPLMYLIQGQRNKANEYIAQHLSMRPVVEDWILRFIDVFQSYDYDADPDKLPVW